MTEEEAKDKWCPVRGDFCLAAECMMWVWDDDEMTGGLCGLNVHERPLSVYTKEEV